ncbi:MAG: patatin-like phospholipase family protein [Bacteroidota bacterium]
MQRIRSIYEAIYYSLPVQLAVIQVRYQKFILISWLFLFLVVTNNFGQAFGIPYLFLEPEYLGEENFYSNFLLGIGLGVYITVYMITSYITNSYRFPFLALEYRPFFVYFQNNFLIPLIFLALYAYRYLKLKRFLYGDFNWWMVGELTGVFVGMAMATLFILLYFFRSNRNFVDNVAGGVVREFKGRRVILEKARMGIGLRIRVDNYLVGFLRIRQPDPNLPANFRKVVEQLLNRNHGNALFLQLILLGVIIVMGILEGNPYFLIPAGTSILLLLSVAMMLIAAFVFWFRRLGPGALLVAVGFYFVLASITLDRYRHPAFGMNYEIAPVPYTKEKLYEVHNADNIRRDRQNTLRTLDLWRSDYTVFHGSSTKPRAVLVCVSGGGLRSAYFVLRSFQKLDSLTQGKFMDRTRLITGASGGMIGAAYYRELYLLNRLGHGINPMSPIYAERLTRDLLNRVAFKIITGLFLPTAKETVGGSKYFSDRGWSFDNQMANNLGVWRETRLSDYTEREELAVIPQMIFSPVIINDGRKLFISSMPATYLTRSRAPDGTLKEAITGVEFSRFFEEQGAEDLLFATALRMNASFPFITPYVRLPSDPPVQIIDAGVADNYGLETAARYLEHFGEWYLQNTDSVFVLQIRDSKAEYAEVPKNSPQSTLRQLLDPIRATYGAISKSNEYESMHSINRIENSLPDKMGYGCLQYAPVGSSGLKASISWHLTSKEIEAIEASLNDSLNQALLNQVAHFLMTE